MHVTCVSVRPWLAAFVKKTFKCNQVFVLFCYKECTTFSHKKSLDICYYNLRFL